MVFKCLECGADNLESLDNTYICRGCGKQFLVKDGIKIFSRETNYYGDVPESEMKEILKDMDHKHWREIVYYRFYTSHPFLHYIITDNNRADWQYMIPLSKDSLVLDVGAGWGTISVPLSTRAKVVALDGTFDRLHFIKKRCKQDRNNNIVDFVCANVMELPFVPNQFDLVVLNGVLEWVGASRDDGNAGEMQLKALKNVYNVLKKDAYLYIGIENRYGFKYLLGEEDDHTGLRHIEYLQRELANKYCKEILNREYRTYTYDKDGYTELLTQTGFGEIRYYYPSPDYKSMRYFMDIDRNVIRYFNENISPKHSLESRNGQVQVLENIAALKGDLDSYVPSYGILCKKVS